MYLYDFGFYPLSFIFGPNMFPDLPSNFQLNTSQHIYLFEKEIA